MRLFDRYCIFMAEHPLIAGITGLSYPAYRGSKLQEVEE